MPAEVAAHKMELAKLLDEASKVRAEPVLPKEMLVYGSGTFGQKIARLLESNGVKVMAMVDRVPKTGLDWQCLAPTELGSLVMLDVALGICNYAVDLAEVIKDLSKWGYTGKIYSPVQIYQLLSASQPPDYFWLSTTAGYIDGSEGILSSYDLLSDDLSRQVYASLWRYRLNGDPHCLPPPQPDQYFAADVPSWKTPIRMIDCGAFTGDTIQWAVEHSIELEAVAAFEPQAENYRQLTMYAKGNLSKLNPLLIPCGVLDRTRQVKFQPDEMVLSSSHVSDEGTITIQCVSIDECLPGFAPNLIKMDTEGCERDALLGAKSTIEKYRPGLAITGYHKPADLWQLPALINNIEPNYKFYMRAHAEHCFETVIYAIAD